MVWDIEISAILRYGLISNSEFRILRFRISKELLRGPNETPGCHSAEQPANLDADNQAGILQCYVYCLEYCMGSVFSNPVSGGYILIPSTFVCSGFRWDRLSDSVTMC